MIYYFMFDESGEYPFTGGWSMVEAANKAEAINAFNAIHPPQNGLTDCYVILDDMEFKRAEYKISGYKGYFCNELIRLKREVYRNE